MAVKFRTTLFFIAVALLLAAFPGAPLHAQFRGTFGPQTTNQTAFTAEASTGPSGNFRNVGQTVHFLTYTTSGTVTQLSIQLEGSDNGTDFIRISDVATNISAGAVYASVYKPIVRANITILAGGGTVTAAYSGASVGLGPPTGIFLTSGTNINFLGNGLDADTTATFDVELPTGGSGGVLYFTYSAAGFAGSTIAVDAGPDTAHLSAVLGATSLANVDTTQAFRVTPFAANVARVTFTTGGATAVTYDLAYSFGGGQATAVDILSSPATGMAVMGVDADGAATTVDPVIVAGTDGAGNTQTIMIQNTGRQVFAAGAVGADGTNATGANIAINDTATSSALHVLPFVNNGTDWDMLRGTFDTGLATGPMISFASASAATAFIVQNSDTNPSGGDDIVSVVASGAKDIFFHHAILSCTANCTWNITAVGDNGDTCTGEFERNLHISNATAATAEAVSQCTTNPATVAPIMVGIGELLGTSITIDLRGLIADASSEDGLMFTSDGLTGVASITVFWYEITP